MSPLFGSIEDKRGVNEPGYEPPVEEVAVHVNTDLEPFGFVEIIVCVFLPIAGLVFAVQRFARNEASQGFACLLMGFLAFILWTFAIVVAVGVA